MSAADQEQPAVRRVGDVLRMPGLVTAHSHAFQRALRARTQQRATAAASFWSWRKLMYRLVEQLDPDSLYAISRFAYAELALSGVTAVGEFHYVHHDRNGTPFADRLEMADAVLRAARDTGVRITLIRTAYLRAGADQALAPAQRRFADPSLDHVLADVDALRQRTRDDPGVEIALAAHSIRAVPIEQTVELARFAAARALPFHMHVAEQRRELEECRAETGRTPVALLAERAVLSPRFVAVHATHLDDEEISALGESGAAVCICRSTERDLGDGAPRIADLVQASVPLSVGVDSHCGADAFDELRAVELDERTRRERRLAALGARELLAIGTRGGLAAIGGDASWSEDRIELDAADPSLAGCADDLLAEAVVFGATPRAVRSVTVAGRAIVDGGEHPGYERARRDFEDVLRRL